MKKILLVMACQTLVVILWIMPNVLHAENNLSMSNVWIHISKHEWKELPHTDKYYGQSYITVDIIRLCDNSKYIGLNVRLRKDNKDNINIYNKYNNTPVKGDWVMDESTVVLTSLETHKKKPHKKYIAAKLAEAKELGYEMHYQGNIFTIIEKLHYQSENERLTGSINIQGYIRKFHYDKSAIFIENIENHMSCKK